MTQIPFNLPPVAGRELEYLSEVLGCRKFSGNGIFTNRCQDWMKKQLGVSDALLTHSCTAALELAALLCQLEPGDEVIMPSFTFVSTANAFVLRGATPVFVDVRADTLNIDESLIEAAITPRTKVICVVHYAGVCAEMNEIRAIADRFGLTIVEDAAQALLSTYHGTPAGRLGDLACFSFHETKNVTAGEGGALTITNLRFCERAHVLWEKGTNRQAFRLGLVDKYSWIDCGSSFLPSEFMSAVLLAQFEQVERFTRERRSVWEQYHSAFVELESAGIVRRPIVPSACTHNGHLYYLLVRDRHIRDRVINTLQSEDIWLHFHYVPLHSSPAGLRYTRTVGSLDITDTVSDRLVRLPLFAGMLPAAAARVIDRVQTLLKA